MSASPLYFTTLGPAGHGVLRTLCAACFDPAGGEGWSAEDLALALTLPGVKARVMTRAAAALGFSLTRQVVDEAELLLIGLSPAWRGQGLGQPLLADAIAINREAGCRILHLEVRADNVAAQALYRKEGFVPRGRRAGYYRLPGGGQADAITYSLDLGNWRSLALS
ncbi:MAG: GNAT family N-acetyltransferase [Pseudomonadota bacterium]|jgi:ribosomal-protein-alanine N-acetyltransferase